MKLVKTKDGRMFVVRDADDIPNKPDADWVRQNWELALKKLDYRQLARAMNYAFSASDLESLKRFYRSGRFKQKIKALLEECNYHIERRNLMAGKRNLSEF